MAAAALQRSREAARKALTSMGPSATVLHNSSQKHGELYLVGVSHVSPTSANLVQKVIRDVQPDVVALELCKTRSKSAILTEVNCEKYKPWEFFSIPGTLTQKLVTYIGTNAYAAFEAKGLKPGAELRTAVEEARTIGARITFVDRDINVTLERVAEHLSLKDAFYFLYDNKRIRIEYRELLLSLREARLGNVDAIKMLHLSWEVVELLRVYFPQLMNAVIDERNEFMVKKLREIKGTVVGVVGALHIPGMQKIWQEAESS